MNHSKYVGWCHALCVVRSGGIRNSLQIDAYRAPISLKKNCEEGLKFEVFQENWRRDINCFLIFYDVETLSI